MKQLMTIDEINVLIRVDESMILKNSTTESERNSPN